MSELINLALSTSCYDEGGDVHVRACVEDAVDLADADVLYFARPTTPDAVAAQLDDYPGCVVCAGSAGDGTLLIAVRGGGLVGRRYAAHVSSVASVLHALLTGQLRITAG